MVIADDNTPPQKFFGKDKAVSQHGNHTRANAKAGLFATTQTPMGVVHTQRCAMKLGIVSGSHTPCMRVPTSKKKEAERVEKHRTACKCESKKK